MSTHAIQPRPEFAAILRKHEEFAVPDRDTLTNRINGWFDRLLVQSGCEIAPGMMLALLVCSIITFGGAAFVLQENLLSTALGAAVGGMAPLVLMVVSRVRRQSQISRQLPAMLDELARAARTGRSLENCLEQVAADTPGPLGDELRRGMQRIRLGMLVPEALREIPQRTGLVATNVFVMALTVHQESGGDLVTVLEQLAHTLRGRVQLQGRLRAATAASRATALLMIAIPPAVLTFFVFRDPAYLTRLLHSEWGLRVTLTAAVLQGIGAVWVLRILRRCAPR